MKQYVGHRQIIFFKSGRKKTINNVVDVEENTLTKLTTCYGTEYLIPREQIEMVERFIPKITIRRKKRKTVKEQIPF